MEVPICLSFSTDMSSTEYWNVRYRVVLSTEMSSTELSWYRGTVTTFKSRIPVLWTYSERTLNVPFLYPFLGFFFRKFLGYYAGVSASYQPPFCPQTSRNRTINGLLVNLWMIMITSPGTKSGHSNPLLNDLSGICRHLFQKRVMNTN